MINGVVAMLFWVKNMFSPVNECKRYVRQIFWTSGNGQCILFTSPVRGINWRVRERARISTARWRRIKKYVVVRPGFDTPNLCQIKQQKAT